MTTEATDIDIDRSTERGGSRLTRPWLLGLLVLVALAPLFLAHEIGRYDVESDFYWTDGPKARAFLSGEMPKSFGFRGPGYPLLLAALGGLLGGQLFLAAKILSVVSAALFVGLVAAVARRHFGPTAALVVAPLVAVQPGFLLHAWSIGTDMTFAAIALASLFLVADTRGRIAWRADLPRAACAGLLAGFALLVRPNGIVLVPMAATVLGLVRSGGLRDRLAPAIPFLIGFVLPTAVWWGVYASVHGTLPASENYRNLAAAAFSGTGHINPSIYAETFETEIQGWGQLLRERSGALLETALRNLPGYLLENARQLHGWATAAAALIGIAVLARTRFQTRAWWLPASGAWFFLSLVPLYYADRFYLFLAAPAAFLATAAIVRGGRTPARLLLTALVVAATAVQSIPLTSERLTSEAGVKPLMGFAAVIRADSTSTGAVAARKPHLAWLAEREMVVTPTAELSELVGELRKAGADYFYYGELELRLAPHLRALCSPHGIPSGLRVVGLRESVPFGILFRVMPEGWTGSPISPELASRLARIETTLERTGTLDQAESQEAIDLDHRGTFLARQGEPCEAVPLFQRAVELRPDKSDFRLALSKALLLCGRIEPAIQAFRVADSLERVPHEERLGFANGLMQQRRWDLAAPILDDALEERPNDADALFYRGVAAAALGSMTEAETLLRSAEAAGHEQSLDFHDWMGIVLVQQGRLTEALPHAEAAIALAPRDPDLRVKKAILEFNLGRKDRARASLEEALRIDPNHAEARDLLSTLP